MKRTILAVLLMIIALPIFSSYTIFAPKQGEVWYTVMDSSGETIKMDDYIYYKRWKGLLLEKIDNGVLMVTENGKSVMIIQRGASKYNLSYNIERKAPTTIIFEDFSSVTPEMLEDAERALLIVPRDSSSIVRSSLERMGFAVKDFPRDGIFNIVGGVADIKEEASQTLVRCPHCQREFYIYI